jgi:hypothetical protein
VWIGWQFDVQRRNGAIGLAAPLASGVTAIVRAEFTPNGRDTEVVVTDLAGYQPADAEGPDTALTVRTGPYGPRTTVPRGTWRLTGNTVSMPGGFEPGKTYEISYRTARVAVAGVGLAAFRDIAAWIRHAPDALARARYTYAFGSSQSGRFLRTFLYYGFNADEQDRPAYDAVVAHIAGAARLSLNERGATPNALSMFSATRFPYADSETRDPITGATDGLLDNPRARRHQPKVFYTNSSVEYWGGGRAAALVHTSPDGKADVALPANVRAYLFSGTQHSPGPFPPRTTTGQQPENPVQYWWTMRALLVAMDRWVRQGEPPPPSQYPRLSDGSLVAADAVRFPEIPSVASPRIISPARHGSTPLPLLVPQVDESGNERAGVHASEVAVPLATYTGWNFRSKAVGGTDQLVNLAGSAVAFARTPAERSRAGDPRKSVEERHRSREQYLTAARDHTESLVRARYLLSEDVPAVMTRMEEVWEAVVGSREALIGSR